VNVRRVYCASTNASPCSPRSQSLSKKEVALIRTVTLLPRLLEDYPAPSVHALVLARAQASCVYYRAFVDQLMSPMRQHYRVTPPALSHATFCSYRRNEALDDHKVSARCEDPVCSPPGTPSPLDFAECPIVQGERSRVSLPFACSFQLLLLIDAEHIWLLGSAPQERELGPIRRLQALTQKEGRHGNQPWGRQTFRGRAQSLRDTDLPLRRAHDAAISSCVWRQKGFNVQSLGGSLLGSGRGFALMLERVLEWSAHRESSVRAL
jgi:hypothetical protein